MVLGGPFAFKNLSRSPIVGKSAFSLLLKSIVAEFLPSGLHLGLIEYLVPVVLEVLLLSHPSETCLGSGLADAEGFSAVTFQPFMVGVQ